MKQGIAHRPLADMESNGVYFDQDLMDAKEEIEICEYSGLPSVRSYEEVEKNTLAEYIIP
jgi:hypothetical protein